MILRRILNAKTFSQRQKRAADAVNRRLIKIVVIISAMSFGSLRHFSQTPTASPENEPLALKVESQPVSAPYKPLKYDEDWSFLRDKSKRSDVFDALKYIPLRRDGRENWYLTVGGEVRFGYEAIRNNQFGAGVQDRGGYYLQRELLYADAHLGRKWRTFIEFGNAFSFGRRGGARQTDRSSLDINQLFVDRRFNFGGVSKSGEAGESNPPNTLTVRVGRQLLNYGSGRLISTRDGDNTQRTFDATRLIWQSKKWRVDGFIAKPVNPKQHFFDDRANSAQTFWGIYATRALSLGPLSPQNKVDVYYLGLDRKNFRYRQSLPAGEREVRQTVGARFFNVGQVFDYDAEIIGQFGRVGTSARRGAIRAFSFHAEAGYTLREVRFSPRIGFGGGIGSGDRNPSDRNLQTFSPLFPKGRFFGEIGQNGAPNYRAVHPSLTFKFPPRITVEFDLYFFWRDSINDGLYSVGGTLLRSGAGSRARYIGAQPGVEANWQVSRHWSALFSYGHFAAGRFLRESPPGQSVDFFNSRVTYRF